MDNKYRIEKISPREVEQITRLYTASFGKTEQAGFFKWKYFDNPAGEALCLAVKDGANIAGSCVMIPEEFYVFGEKSKIYKCCDLMVHPQYRRQGLATKLIFAFAGYFAQAEPLFLYTLCDKNATRRFLKNRWVKVDDLMYYFKHKAHLKAKFLFSRVERLFDRGILRPIGSAADLCREYKFKVDENRVHIAKEEKYISWKLRNPRYKYEITGYYEKGGLKGYVIYNTGIHNNLCIMDLDADSAAPGEIISALLSSAELAACRANRFSVIAPAVRDGVFQKIIKKNGYLNNPFRKGPLKSILDFNILVDGGENSRVLNRANWHFSPLNYDDI